MTSALEGNTVTVHCLGAPRSKQAAQKEKALKSTNRKGGYPTMQILVPERQFSAR
jgi:hypothetical protein